MIPHIRQDYRIVGSIINCFYQRLYVSNDDHVSIAKSMLSRLDKPNTLERIIKRYAYTSSNNFVTISDKNQFNFPQFSIKEFENNITFGSYQIEQSLGYIKEHLDKNGDFQLLINEKDIKLESSQLVCCKFYSRHKSQTLYTVYVLFDPNEASIKSISEWYCTCKVGARTVGCCSHVAALIYYLSIDHCESRKLKKKYSSNIINAKEFSQLSSKTLFILF
jgi:hypothetical protein